LVSTTQAGSQESRKEERCQGKKLTTAHDIYTLFVGEIGIPRREFLYDLQYWETFSIIEGYRKRDRIKLQLLAQVVYSSMYTMRDPQGKKASDLFPQLFEDDEEWESPISEEEANELAEEMRRMNQELAKNSGTQE
jgi:hypothetical protein